MSLLASRLSAAIKAGILEDPAARDNASLQKLCDKIAEAVVAEIQANAVVTVASGIAVATTGSATAQTGATTGTGTGTIA